MSKGKCSRFGEKMGDGIKSGDSFAESFQFKLPNGKAGLNTWKGCIYTAILFSAVVFYGVAQFVKMEAFDDTDVMESVRDSFYAWEDVFEGQMAFAFGITVYDSNPMPIEDPTIGTIFFQLKRWSPDGSVGRTMTLPSEPC